MQYYSNGWAINPPYKLDDMNTPSHPKPSPPQRQYPPVYEKIIPIALGVIALAIIVLLVVIFVVLAGAH